MEKYMIDFDTLIENPARIRSISKYELATTYLTEAIDKGKFEEYFSLIQKAEYGIAQAILAACNCTVFSFAEFYKNELEYLPPEPKFEYGSQSLIQFFYDMLKSYFNKIITLEKYRKQTLFRAVEVLSQDEFKVFKLAITKSFDYRLNDAMIELFNSGYFIGSNLEKYFLIGFKTEALKSVPSDIFKRNTTNTEYMYFPENELGYYLLVGHTFVKLNSKFEKIADQNDPFIAEASKNKIVNSNPKIYIVDGTEDIGVIDMTRCAIYREFRKQSHINNVTEHAFSIKLCEGLKNVLILSGEPNPTADVLGCISYENGTLKETTKKVSEFSTTVLPYYGYSASVINCKDKDTENQFYIFAKTNDANKIGKTRQNFKVTELLDQYYLIGTKDE